MEQRPGPPLPLKATPYRHQREAFAFVCRLFGLDGGDAASGGAALLMEMGTGKTITSVAICGALSGAGRIGRVLIVAPLSILGVWSEEFSKFAAFDYALSVLTGTGAKKAETLRRMTGPPLQIAVINYESAWRLEKEIPETRPHRCRRGAQNQDA